MSVTSSDQVHDGHAAEMQLAMDTFTDDGVDSMPGFELRQIGLNHDIANDTSFCSLSRIQGTSWWRQGLFR